ncbi:hypothetical protein VP01_2254g4 [Puccinia sorghi]|uniref:Uncharacterized protein n=1 Tax=Puccinia sorghi TaxID=27349 RepID=A0A0L6V937_9BASI|nr:hypothetical protein VP01_2254g4 [Puccinia sorghi]
MSSRWRERKGNDLSFVSGAPVSHQTTHTLTLSGARRVSNYFVDSGGDVETGEGQGKRARRKALLAPVQRYRRGWVQLRPDTGYKVLKWVPRDSVPGTPIGGTGRR